MRNSFRGRSHSNRKKRRNVTRKNNHVKRLKYNMVGCSHKKNCTCKSCKLNRMKGGCGCDKINGGKSNKSKLHTHRDVVPGKVCHICGHSIEFCRCKSYRGGYSNPALIGDSWTSNISNWPGVSGTPGETNHYALNQYHVDPQTQVEQERIIQNPVIRGGNNRRYTRRHNKNTVGGGILPTDLVNMGRGTMYGLGNIYNTLSGYSAPVNPLPYKDQLIK
jgi:hypothetical protein